jgi:competence ComEA-like helix-hairpin-helix protein
MEVTPQERTALVVIGLLLAAGLGVRLAAPGPEPAVWEAEDAPGRTAAPRAEVQQALSEAARRALPLDPGELLDPNQVDAVELARLPRVGPAVAARIVAHREEHGPFRSRQELLAVRGVGPAVLEAISPYLSLPEAAPVTGPASASRTGAGSAAPSGPVDVNRAPAGELMRIPGVGPALAARIVEERRTGGPFRTLDELTRVTGIGERTVERMRGHAVALP